MAGTITLSDAALAVLRRHVERGGMRVDDSNREAYRELARAGIMYPLSGFAGGPESHYRFTDEGWSRRGEWLGNGHRGSSARGSLPRG